MTSGWNQFAGTADCVDYTDPRIVKGSVLARAISARIDARRIRLSWKRVENGEAILVYLAVRHQLFGKAGHREGVRCVDDGYFLERRLVQRFQTASLLVGPGIRILSAL